MLVTAAEDLKHFNLADGSLIKEGPPGPILKIQYNYTVVYVSATYDTFEQVGS